MIIIIMLQRQSCSKSDNDVQAFFTYHDERKKLGYSDGRERPFNACCICLQPVIHPLSCNKGHLFCKECIFECLLAQKKDIKRKLASFTNQEKTSLDVEEHRDTSQDADRHTFTNHNHNHNRAPSYEEEALRTMKAFWLPSTSPAEVVMDRRAVQAPSFDTYCPEGNEKLKLKDLFQIVLLEEEEDGGQQDHVVACPSCSVKLTSAVTLVAISTCGHLFCKKCADHVGKGCLVCNKPCKAKNLVVLERSGFSGRHEDDGLEASSFTCVGSGNKGPVVA